MRIVCPECHAAYKIGAIIKNAILVCHRCDTEFDTYGNKIAPENETKQIFKNQEESAPTFGLSDLMQSGMKGQKEQVWLWLFLVLLTLSVLGIAMQWQHWQFSGVVRAIEIETQSSAKLLDRDWRILPESVNSEWLKREDDSLVLIISGKVENQVATSLSPPEIRVTFNTQIGENIVMTMPITEPADIKTLKTVPFSSPPVDNTPVSMLKSRGFMLLIENAPQTTQHILLHAIATQHSSQAKL